MTYSYPLVEVTWEDSCSCRGWYDHAEAQALTFVTMKTVGYRVRSDHRVVALAQTVGDNGKMSEVWLIPRASVKKVRVL